MTNDEQIEKLVEFRNERNMLKDRIARIKKKKVDKATKVIIEYHGFELGICSEYYMPELFTKIKKEYKAHLESHARDTEEKLKEITLQIEELLA